MQRLRRVLRKSSRSARAAAGPDRSNPGYLEPLTGGLLDSSGQPEPVERPHRVEGLQHEEVEHAVRHVRPRFGHVTSLHEHV